MLTVDQNQMQETKGQLLDFYLMAAIEFLSFYTVYIKLMS